MTGQKTTTLEVFCDQVGSEVKNFPLYFPQEFSMRFLSMCFHVKQKYMTNIDMILSVIKIIVFIAIW